LVECHNLLRAAYFVEMGPICSLVTCPFFLLLASLRQAAVALAVVAAEAEDASKAFLEGIPDKHGPTGSSTPFRARPDAHDHSDFYVAPEAAALVPFPQCVLSISLLPVQDNT